MHRYLPLFPRIFHTSSDPSNVYLLGNILDKVNGTEIVLPAATYSALNCVTDKFSDYSNGCNYGGVEDLKENPVYQALCGKRLSGGKISNELGDCSSTVTLQSEAQADNAFDIDNWYFTEDLAMQDSNGKPLDISSWSSIVIPSSLVLDVTTLFVRQARNAHACVVYSNVITISPSPSPIGIFHD